MKTNIPSIQIGKNGHEEYGWDNNNNIKESILQLSFQLIRTNNPTTFFHLENKLREILETIIKKVIKTPKQGEEKEQQEINESIDYFIILFKLTAHIRDIIQGKGECLLFYMMVLVWYEYFPEYAKYALYTCVYSETDEHPYGSWKDIKYLCNYCFERTKNKNHPLIEYAINIMNYQLRKDVEKDIKNNNDMNNLQQKQSISLVSKWIPREKSKKFGWLHKKLACNYFADYLYTAKNDSTMTNAIKKAMMNYRKIYCILNKKLDTVQIKQSANNYTDINYKNVTSITLSKQANAFLNIKKDGNIRFETIDRIQSEMNFKYFIESNIDESFHNESIKGKRVNIIDFVKRANKPNLSQIEKDVINLQWNNNASQNVNLRNMIVMMDISNMMIDIDNIDNNINGNNDAIYAALGLGCRIAEKSILGKRIMTFNTHPEWINLENCNDFVSMIKVLKNIKWGLNANFHSALDMILVAIIENEMSAEAVEDMVLVILSTMQIDEPNNQGWTNDTLYKIIEKKYIDAGIQINGKPYKPPHILFWNVNSTNGFPCLSTQRNTSMISGYNPILLNQFGNKKRDKVCICNPYQMLINSLHNKRYQKMEDYILLQQI